MDKGPDRGFADLLTPPADTEGADDISRDLAEAGRDPESLAENSEIEAADCEEVSETIEEGAEKAALRAELERGSVPQGQSAHVIGQRGPQKDGIASRRDLAAMAFGLASRSAPDARTEAVFSITAGAGSAGDAPAGSELAMAVAGVPEETQGGQESGRVPLVDPGRASAPAPLQASSGQAAARHVAVQIVTALPMAEGGRTEILLNPEELGRVALQMRIDGDSVLLSIDADRAETLDLIRRHLSELSDELRGLGYGAVDFTFRERGNRASPEENSREPDPSDMPPVERAVPSHQILVPLPAGLDLRV